MIYGLHRAHTSIQIVGFSASNDIITVGGGALRYLTASTCTFTWRKTLRLNSVCSHELR